ncbi:MAG: hypothetical protein JNM45_01275 [Rhizobiales bacterium]|nr:hypothetical protein [Hyphomicrobiales bacterium]
MRYLVLMCLALATPAAAEDVSPWFGSADQVPFQMASDGSPVVIKSKASGDIAGQQEKSDCSIKGCSVADSAANVPGTGHVSP